MKRSNISKFSGISDLIFTRLNNLLLMQRQKMRGAYDSITDPGYNRNQHHQKNSQHNMDSKNFLHLTNSFDLYSPYQMFKKMSYPIDLYTVNPFCPICGAFVKNESDHLTFQSQRYSKKFLAHQKCLNAQPSTPLSGIYDQIQQAIVKNQPLSNSQNMMMIALGSRQFYTQLIVSHPLSDYKFVKMSIKTPLLGSGINWDLHSKEQNNSCYDPNIICVPTYDFKLTVFLSEIGVNSNKTSMHSYVNLSRQKSSKQDRTCVVNSQNFSLQIKIVQNQAQKQRLKDQMNYKYRYDKSLPMVQLKKIFIRLPDQFEEEDQFENNNECFVSEILEEKKSPGQSNPSTTVMNLISYSDILSERSYESQQNKVDLETLIATNQLIAFVTHSTGSRVFQKYLNETTSEQVDIIIENLKNYIAELIMHDYANYMVQKLFTVCSPQNRLDLMKLLKKDIPYLVKNKQGTHTIQSFISLFTNYAEFEIMCEAIQNEFLELSCHPNSTHFIQKIIKIFPIQQTLNFFYIANKHFLEFATDKNAMCVLKYMLKKIKQKTTETKPLTFILDLQKQLITSITLNADIIIQDSFGNYIVQFCYELFGQQKCEAITQMIVNRFSQFSIQKYSSSVVLKCISTYWTKIEPIQKLRQTLGHQGILEMYRNRDGNKILLQIMEKYENTLLREKIFNFLIMGQTTKFFHEKWGIALGSRSGTVGTHFQSFSDATGRKHKQPSRKEKGQDNQSRRNGTGSKKGDNDSITKSNKRKYAQKQ